MKKLFYPTILFFVYILENTSSETFTLTRNNQPNNSECQANGDCISDCCIFVKGKEGLCVGRPTVGQVCGLINSGSRLPWRSRNQGIMNHVNLSPLLKEKVTAEMIQKLAANPQLLQQVLQGSQLQGKLNLLATRKQQLQDVVRRLGRSRIIPQNSQGTQRNLATSRNYGNLFRSGANAYDYANKGKSGVAGSSFSGYNFGNFVVG